MKKHLILFCCFCLLSSFAFSQNLGGGLSLGANISQIDGDNFAGYNKFGFSLGGFVTFKVSEVFQVQPEFLWDQLGSAGNNGTFSNRFNYISVPMIAQFRFPLEINGKVRRLQLQTGIVMGVLLNAIDTNINPPNNDLTDEFKQIDWRWAIGAQFDLTETLAFNARFNYSIAPFGVGTSNDFPTGPYHNYLQFSFRLHLIKE